MKRFFQTTLNNKDEVFKNISFTKENKPLSISFNKKDSIIDSNLNTNSSLIEDMRFEQNTTVIEDVYYDEIIYYDGGGVEGYGD